MISAKDFQQIDKRIFMHISPSNVTEITLALFYITDKEIRQKYNAVAIDLVDKLSQAWYQCTQSGNNSDTKVKTLINSAQKIISILKPTAKLRIEKQINCV